jgi:hypothetical protein
VLLIVLFSLYAWVAKLLARRALAVDDVPRYTCFWSALHG